MASRGRVGRIGRGVRQLILKLSRKFQGNMSVSSLMMW